MSTIRVDNFGPSAGGTTYSAGGIAKAYSFYSQTVPAVRDSLNVSSITDDGVGLYTLSFTNGIGSSFETRNMAGMCPSLDRLVTFAGTAGSSSQQMQTYDVGSGQLDTNSSVIIHGDLA